MKDASSDVRIIEIFPPSVQTELHDARHQPDLKNGAQIGMPLEDFTEAAHNAIIRGEEDIVIGAAEEWYYPFEPLRHGRFTELVEKLRDYGK
ncbi:uncharacterized protein TrAtP1_009668 [Trichoderma atroviride]|nr:hypothetical protein TrAtP1_009668 [Trichoderma atroviride]